MLPRLLQVSSVLALVVLGNGCSDPQCPYEFMKVGKVCRRIPVDASGMLEDGGALETDDAAATLEAGSKIPRDAQPGVDAAEASTCPGQCVAGEETACTTSCGSDGRGQCGTGCGLPSADECTAPPETCNWVDDDCDGKVDPGMLTQDTAGTRVWTQANAGNSHSTVAMLPRTGGGAWWLYRTTPGATAATVKAALLGTDGRLSGPIKDLPKSETSGHFVAGSSEHFVAVAMRHVGVPRTVKVHLYRTADLTHVDEIEVASTTNDCDLFAPQAVNLIEQENGDLSVAVLRAHVPGAIDPSNGLCSFTTRGPSELLLLKRSASGAWAPTRKVANAGEFGALGGMPSDLYRVPCRDEWILAYTSNGSVLKRISTSGQELPQTVDTFTSTQSVIAGPNRMACGADTASVTLPMLYVQGTDVLNGGGTAHVRFLAADTVSGSFARLGADLTVPTLMGAAIFEGVQGSHYLAGIDSKSKLRVFQLFATPHEAREVNVASEVPSSNAMLGGNAFLGAGSGTRVVGGAFTGESVALGASRGTPTTTLVAPGDAAPPIAATHVIGCAK